MIFSNQVESLFGTSITSFTYHLFTSKNFLRIILKCFLYLFFRLPGEAMQIDRIMEAFAKHYCRQNPNLFDETDTCYLLSFSIIMLNTALHNPNVKKKITCEQFVAQNRGINSGKDLPRDILVSILSFFRTAILL